MYREKKKSNSCENEQCGFCCHQAVFILFILHLIVLNISFQILFLSIYTEFIKVKVIINVFTVLSVVKYSPVVLNQTVVTEQIGLVEPSNILF